MLFLIVVAFVVSTPQYFGFDEYSDTGCKGEKQYSEFAYLGFCRHFKDHSEKTTYHSSIQAEASFFADKDCTGESRDYTIDLGCHRAQHERERDQNMTYFDSPPKGNLENIFSTDSTCSKDFEGGLVFYPKQDVCTTTHHRVQHVNSFKYSCNATYVTYNFYFDPDCKSHSHIVSHPIGCHKSEGTEGLYVQVTCSQ